MPSATGCAKRSKSRKRSGGNRAFLSAALVELGLISPGAALYDPAARHEAQVRADGSIACAGATGSIHKIGAHVQGASACNGWTFWHYEAEGSLKPIDALRDEARRQLAS